MDTPMDTLSIAASRATTGLDTMDTAIAPARVGARTHPRTPARVYVRARVSTGVHPVHTVHTHEFNKKNNGQLMDSSKSVVSR